MQLASSFSRALSTLPQLFNIGGISHYLPRRPSLSPAARQGWLEQGQAPAVYTGAPRLPFPVLPFQVFALHYDVDIVVETHHPNWRMHEFARIAIGKRNLWMVKDADGDGIQTVNADLPHINQWFPEIPVPRHATVVDVHDRSTAKRFHLHLTYKCLFKNNFTYIATTQDVLDCGSITFILDLEPGRQTV